MKLKKVVYTKIALSKCKTIKRDINRKHGQYTAERISKYTSKTISQLKQFPEMSESMREQYNLGEVENAAVGCDHCRVCYLQHFSFPISSYIGKKIFYIREEYTMIQNTLIIGMGALGLLYADIIAKAKGQDAVAFVMDEQRLAKYKDTTFTINGESKQFRMILDKEAKPADLLIVAVKYNGLRPALETMRDCVDEHTIIMSVMNGIDSEEIIAGEFGKEHMIYTVAQGMDAMKFDNDLTYTKRGELRIGVIEESQKANLEAVTEFFKEVQMPHAVEEDILKRIWGKFMLNVGVNQTCLAFSTNYAGTLTEGSEENWIFIAAMEEVIALANAYGIALSQEDLDYYVKIIGTLSPTGVPSMRQDGIAKRYSEVEMFAGTVMRLAKPKNISTPANDLLYKKIKEIESNY